LKRACGKLSCKEVEQYVKSDRFVQLDGSHVTTDQAKLEEEQLLDYVQGGWDTCEPIGRNFALDIAELTDEQRKALEHILASRDLVMDAVRWTLAERAILLVLVIHFPLDRPDR
jgi:hypothetical protein